MKKLDKIELVPMSGWEMIGFDFLYRFTFFLLLYGCAINLINILRLAIGYCPIQF